MNAFAAALHLAERRIPSFPCLANKAPACLGGFKAATAHPDALRDLWRRHPGELIGVPTGPVSGFDVLDVDPRHGGDVWLAANQHRLPVSRRHTTRSGGLHMLFRHHDGVRNSASKIAPGIDVRGAGGFVVWWPAAGCAVPVRGPLATWPDWPLAMILPKPQLPSTPCREPVLRASSKLPDETAAERIIRRVLWRLETAAPGERHPRLCAAARTIGGLLQSAGISEDSAGEALFDAIKRAGGSDVVEKNARDTIASGLQFGAKAPLTIGGHNAGR